ncbi:MAG: FapA family protein [Pseudomonadota bacterium]
MPITRNDIADYPPIGKLALKYGLITLKQLDKALDICLDTPDSDQALAEYMVRQGLVSELDMKRLLTAAKAITLVKKDIKFGAIAVRKRFIGQMILDMALEEQRRELLVNKRSRMLGDILEEAGMITARQKEAILIEQKRLKFEDSLFQAPGEVQSPFQEDGRLRSRTVSGQTSFMPESPLEADKGHETLENGLILKVSNDNLYVHLTKTHDFNDTMTAENIRHLLSKHAITHGIVDDTLIEGFITSKAFKEKAFRIAAGDLPIPGVDGTIRFLFDTERLKAGLVDDFGAMDFKDRGEIPQVEPGTLLAEKIPAVDPKNGKTVQGETIEMRPANDVEIKYDTGTTLSDDRLKLYAAISGQPVISWAGCISVLEEFATKGDVDYETGHLDFKGNVRVRGCIQSGFKVTGSTIVAEEIDGGILHAEGDIIIAGGIHGAKLYARGTVTAAYVHTSEITCLGDISIKREIVDTTIETSGACRIESGKIITSRIWANQGVFAREIGTERAKPSIITAGVDRFLIREMEMVDIAITRRKKWISRILEAMERFGQQADGLQTAVTNLAHVQDRAQLEVTRIQALMKKSSIPPGTDPIPGQLHEAKAEVARAEAEVNQCFDAMEKLEKRKNRMETGLEKQEKRLADNQAEMQTLTSMHNANPGKAVIETRGAIQAGTVVAGRNTEKTIDQTVNNAVIKELLFTKPGEDQAEPWWEMRVTNR